MHNKKGKSMLMKILYILLMINFFGQFIKNIRTDKKTRDIASSILMFIIKVYFMINVYWYIF